ncbi:thioester domain-containing protein [Arcanobacterium phocae]|uniref:thioester domain-containing protein n=1 Tax=Arcanobacterium phocae TaxID=131112 RepID=UPI001C0EEAAF|nr:thioester domain-containing protein [Arcanobacterium phocae]
MTFLVRIVQGLLVVALFCSGMGMAYGDERKPELLPQDGELVGLNMRYLPAVDAGSQAGYTQKTWHARPALFSVKNVGEGVYHAYCLEITVPTDRQAPLHVTNWDGFVGNNAFRADKSVRQKVAWIVQHSYPARSLEYLAHEVGVTELSIQQAVTATQSAIWHLTDGVTPDFSALGQQDTDGVDAQGIAATYHYLLSSINVGLTQESLQPTVAFSLPEGDSFAGQLVGPIRVEANVPTVSIEVPEGFSLASKVGDHIDPANISSGQEIYVDARNVHDAGKIDLTGTVNTAELNGSLLTPGISAENHGQTLIMVRELTKQIRHVAHIGWRSEQDVCRDVDGIPVTDSVSGRILPKDSPQCVVVPAVNETPESSQLSDDSGKQHEVSEVSSDRPQLAKTGSEIYVLVSLATITIAVGIALTRRERRKYREVL